MNDYARAADLELYAKFQQMFDRRLKEIPVQTIVAPDWPEDAADIHFSKLGFNVFHSRARNGYRCLVDAPANWRKLNAVDRGTYNLFHSTLPLDQFILLIHAIRDKVGTPDLLLLKDAKVSFVEVKAVRELVQPCTIKFFLSYGHLWPMSILRVLKP